MRWRWRIRQPIPLSCPTGRARPKTRRLPILLLPQTAVRSRPAHSPDRTGLRNTISSCASRKNLANRQSMQAPQSSDDDGLAGSEVHLNSSKLTHFNVAISAIAALAGIIFAGIQTFLPNAAPINVTLAGDPTSSVGKIDVPKTTEGS